MMVTVVMVSVVVLIYQGRKVGRSRNNTLPSPACPSSQGRPSPRIPSHRPTPSIPSHKPTPRIPSHRLPAAAYVLKSRRASRVSVPACVSRRRQVHVSMG